MYILKNIKKYILLYFIINIIVLFTTIYFNSPLIVILIVSINAVLFLFLSILVLYIPIKKLNTSISNLFKNKKILHFFKNKNTNKNYEYKVIEDVSFFIENNVINKNQILKSLPKQINLHFLYNTLETIRGQALLDDNENIASMIEALASYFRYNISSEANVVTIRNELDNIDSYMFIQKVRFNNRFSLNVLIDDEDRCVYDYLIPKMILQPIVENSILHGLEKIIVDGRITIDITLSENNLLITISDNGIGIEEHLLEEINKKLNNFNVNEIEQSYSFENENNIALSNINERIKLLYGNEYGIRIYSVLNVGTDVEIIMPINKYR